MVAREGGRIESLRFTDANIVHRMDNNKVLLYSTGGHSQRLVTNYNGED